MDLFGRRARVTVDTLQVDGLHIQFKIKKTLKTEPNTCDVMITNLSQASRSQMQKKGAQVTVEAGYVGELGVIFSGDSRTIDHLHAGPDWITKIQCGDGERSYQFDYVNIARKAGTARLAVLTDVLKTMRVGAGNVVNVASAAVAANPNLATFRKGFSVHGRSSTALDLILKPLGIIWSIQDGAVQAMQEESGLDTVVDLGADSGLVGSPSHGTPDKKGKPSLLKARTLLRPQIKPGHKVFLRSESATGLFRVDEIEHVGDSAAQEWYSELSLRPI